VTKGDEQRAGGIQRYSVTSRRTYSLDVIDFEQLVRTEHVVRIHDFSVIGVGIESGELIGPGLVCFREPVGGQKCGVVIWSKPKGEQYRMGIRFVIVPSEEEAYLHQQVRQSHPRKALHDPDRTIALLLESIRNETNR
jgi:hypothetical protein